MLHEQLLLMSECHHSLDKKNTIRQVVNCVSACSQNSSYVNKMEAQILGGGGGGLCPHMKNIGGA